MGIGRNIIDGLINGIKSGFNGLKSLWGQINSYMPDFMRKKMDIHSPSRVMRGIGRFIVAGLEVGLGQQHGSLQKTYQRIVDTFTAPPPVEFYPGANLPDQQQTVWQRLNKAAIPAVPDQTQNILQKVTAYVKPMLDEVPIFKLFDQIKSGWRQLWNGLENISDKFPEHLKTLLEVQTSVQQPALATPSFSAPVQLPPIVTKPLIAGAPSTPTAQASKQHQITVEGDSISIYVTAQPGQSTQDIAAEVQRQLRSYEREKAMRVRDQFWDNQ